MHEANVVAVALVHRVAAILTEDTRHLARFAELVPIEDLGAAPA